MGSPPNAKEMLATVRAWLNTNYPGCVLECVKIRVHGMKKSLRIYESPVPAPSLVPQPKSFNDEETVKDDGDADERGPGLAPCAHDILTTLRESDRPLTKALLLEQMGRKNREWSERTVDKYLKSLMEDATIENPPDARPRGYRLAE